MDLISQFSEFSEFGESSEIIISMYTFEIMISIYIWREISGGWRLAEVGW